MKHPWAIAGGRPEPPGTLQLLFCNVARLCCTGQAAQLIHHTSGHRKRTVMPDTNNHDGMWFATTSADMNSQLTSRLQLHCACTTVVQRMLYMPTGSDKLWQLTDEVIAFQTFDNMAGVLLSACRCVCFQLHQSGCGGDVAPKQSSQPALGD